MGDRCREFGFTIGVDKWICRYRKNSKPSSKALSHRGRFASAQEAIAEGIRLLVSNETLRQEIQIGIHQADRGEVHDHDTVFAQLKAMATESQASNG